VARKKRPVLDRDGPIRNWASAVSPESSTSPNGAPAAGAEPKVDDQDPIVRGVVSGGKVVDEWIRQAQQAARLLGSAPASTAGWADASGRMFKVTSDLMASWWSMLGVLPPNGPAASPPGSNHQSAWQAHTPPPVRNEEPRSPSSHEPISSSAGPRLRVEVASRRPVEVTVDMHRRGVAKFRVLDLRPEGDGQRIRGIELEPWDQDGLRLRLTVPDDQPVGIYHAVVLDAAADYAVGTITLKIPA
jgi:hypothetical protein